MPSPTNSKLTTTDWSAVLTVPPNKRGVYTVNVAPLGACKVKLAVTGGAAPGDADIVENDVALAIGAGPLARDGIVLDAGSKIYVKTDTANMAAVQVWFVEEAA
ncbi:hypothetical protein [Aureimonas sp. AU40]|uniref:hypothetical protein n=1 Tax=Aureimonas sp. AU40 TaxID=1637747 RepID=UPI000782F504|nr:hypothetical protein [Aureimonas sp. AU40]